MIFVLYYFTIRYSVILKYHYFTMNYTNMPLIYTFTINALPFYITMCVSL